VLNMRTQTADEVCAALLSDIVTPNVPAGKVTAPTQNGANSESPA